MCFEPNVIATVQISKLYLDSTKQLSYNFSGRKASNFAETGDTYIVCLLYERINGLTHQRKMTLPVTLSIDGLTKLENFVMHSLVGHYWRRRSSHTSADPSRGALPIIRHPSSRHSVMEPYYGVRQHHASHTLAYYSQFTYYYGNRCDTSGIISPRFLQNWTRYTTNSNMQKINDTENQSHKSNSDMKARILEHKGSDD